MSSLPLPCVATLIAPVADPDLAAAATDLGRILPNVGETRKLDDRALDLAFAANPEALPALRQAAAAWRGTRTIDVILQPVADRRKALFLADMDSTMIEQECIDELADFAGLKPMVAAITERAMRGELAFELALRERVALLKGLPIGVVDSVLRDRITLTPGGKVLVRTMRANGCYCALVSGGFTLFTAPVAATIGFNENRGNILLIEADQLSGLVADPIFGRDAKLEALRTLRARFALAEVQTMAVGDGANDLAMIAEAGLGIAFRAKPAVAAAAAGRIDHNDLSALLFVQGYARSAFVEG